MALSDADVQKQVSLDFSVKLQRHQAIVEGTNFKLTEFF